MAVSVLPKSKRRPALIKSNDIKILEKDIQKQIIRYLEWSGCYVKPITLGGNLHTVDQKTFVKRNPLAGFPDLLVIHKGRYMHLEVKTATGRISDKQQLTMMELKQHGAKVFIVRCVEDAKKALAHLVGNE